MCVWVQPAYHYYVIEWDVIHVLCACSMISQWDNKMLYYATCIYPI